MPTPSNAGPQALAIFDARPFFEQVLQYGRQHGILSLQRLQAMCEEGPKGMLQIARYFGTEYLRPDLELAKLRMVNLISLYLAHCHGTDLHPAAAALRDHSLQSRSKGGSDLLKAMITMPQSSHFGMQERSGFQDQHIPALAKWTLRSLPELQAEQRRRARISTLVEAAVWMASELGLDTEQLEQSDADAEAVLRTALLVRWCKLSALPDWPGLEKLLLGLRRKFPDHGVAALALTANSLPVQLPQSLHEPVLQACAEVAADLPALLDSAVTLRKLLRLAPAFVGRYFWREDPLAEMEQFERSGSAVWDKATSGHSDDSSLLTLFLLIAAGARHTTLLSEKTALALVRKMRKSGLDAELPRQFIRQQAPARQQPGYLSLWDTFIAAALPLLRSDASQAQHDALALLRRDCNVSP